MPRAGDPSGPIDPPTSASRPLTSRALRAACDDASPTVMQQRVRELREAGFVALGDAGYALTDLGRELRGTFMPLHQFAERWAKARRADCAA
ncbi:MAG: hypothetical protein NVS9B8_01870 [Candidatus Limnocylindrales bacterium]